MDTVNCSGGFVRREVVSRPIIFERYRKPCQPSYPRNAIVLNKRHTRELQWDNNEGTKNQGDGDESSPASVLEPRNRELMDSDDPFNMDTSLMLCSDEKLIELLHLRWLKISRHGCGLQNYGNTCFINSVLQAVAYTPALAQYLSFNFKSPHRETNVEAPFDFAYALAETIRQIHSTVGPYKPSIIISNVKILSSRFRVGAQGDAHEFLLNLLHACNRSILHRQVGFRKVEPYIEQTTPLQRIIGGYLRSTIAWNRNEEISLLYKNGNAREASDLKMSVSQCSGAKRDRSDTLISNTYDPFVTLSTDIVGHTLERCLAHLFAEEELDGPVYKTPRGVKVHATKQFKLHKLPNVLIIHIKRFNEFGARVGKFIRYPKVLNIAPYCTTDGTLRGLHSQRRDEGKSCDGLLPSYDKRGGFSVGEGSNGDIEYLYELNSVCVHQGSSISHGHYFTVVRASNGMWIECNDAHISNCDEERALSQQAYMLFYSRLEKNSAPGAHKSRKSDYAPQLVSEVSSRHANSRQVFGTPSHLVSRDRMDDIVGREITEEEAMRMITSASEKSRKKGSQSDISRNDTSIGLPDKLNGEKTRPPFGLTNRNFTSFSHSSEQDRSGSSSFMSMSKDDVKVRGSQVSPGHGGSAGLEKPLHTGAPHGACALKTSLAPSLPRKGSDLIGGDVVRAMEQERRSTPASVMRPSHAPGFRQQVRDPLWEEEIDRGHVKRTKYKREDKDSTENKFQNANVTFDSRGRRC
uniref:Ubiquitin carboxyl-terminal hydrolase n=1 Tax=Trypanosoma congolense (strain IL3000) TaxID=1068625 RepID=G0V0G7_TRYCI|nr:putative ubiquitin carboxyl-terminal hydrolase [Trypanosoma congolense IL3000]